MSGDLKPYKMKRILSACILLAVALACSRKENPDMDLTVASGNATDITEWKAVLNGKLNRKPADDLASAWFLYAPGELTLEELMRVGNKLPARILEDGSFSQATLDRLLSGVVYSFVAGARASGTTVYGEPVLFSSARLDITIVTGDITDITSTGATLNGSYSLKGDEELEKYTFGGISVAENPEDLKGLRELVFSVNHYSGMEVEFSRTLVGLKPATTYYYMCFVRVYDSVFYGEVRQFTTLEEE